MAKPRNTKRNATVEAPSTGQEGAAESDADGPPEEIGNAAPPPDATQMPVAGAPKKRRRGGKNWKKKRGEDDELGTANNDEDESEKDKVDSAEPDSHGFFWQVPQNQKLLLGLQAASKKKKERVQSLDKDGVRLEYVNRARQMPVATADDFLREELFDRRIRKRTVKTRYDRNVFGRIHASHRTQSADGECGGRGKLAA